MPGPMQPRPVSAAMEWCNYLDALLEAGGDVPEAELSAQIDEAIDTLERRGAVSADDAAALRVVYSAAE